MRSLQVLFCTLALALISHPTQIWAAGGETTEARAAEPRPTRGLLHLITDWSPGEGLPDTEDSAEDVLTRLKDKRYEGQYGSERVAEGARASEARVSEKSKLGKFFKWPWFITLKSWWTSWKEQGGDTPFDWKTHCGSWIPGIGPYGEVLSCWLNLHPQVTEKLVWEEVNPVTGNVVALSYPNWSETQKIQLNAAFYYAYTWLKDDLDWFSGEYLPDPPSNLLNPTGWNYPCTQISKDAAAWKLYLGTVAHSLALEIGGFVPWSVLGYAPQDLETLFHSKSLFKGGAHNCKTYDDKAKTKPKSFTFNGYAISGRIIPAAPTTTFEFLVNENIIQSDHYKTITQLLDWSRDEMHHYFDSFWTANIYDHWQYRGAVPAKYVIKGTTYTGQYASQFPGDRHWTAGCSGTTHFFRAVMRAVNIPVRSFRESCGHVMPIFSTIGYASSHGDDPYGSLDSTPEFHASLLLVPNPKFMFWFIIPEDTCGNVGRQVRDVALKTLPNVLLERYCDDLKNGLSHADGTVYELFKNYFSLSYLEGENLWGKAAQKAAKLGYCSPLQYKAYDVKFQAP